jgi:hypothetical protein
MTRVSPGQATPSTVQRATRAALLAGQSLPADVVSRDRPLAQDLAFLAIAPRLRIAAARQVQAAKSHHKRLSKELFLSCKKMRTRVLQHYRRAAQGPLRRAFGCNYPASANKPQSVLRFATMILGAAREHQAAFAALHVMPSSLARIERLQGELAQAGPRCQRVRRERMQLYRALLEAATRVQARVESHAPQKGGQENLDVA